MARGVEGPSVERPVRVGRDAQSGVDVGGDIGVAEAFRFGGRGDARAVRGDPGGALRCAAPAVAAFVTVAVVGHRDDGPLLGPGVGTCAYGGEELSESSVGRLDRVPVLGAAAEEVGGLVDGAEIDEGGVQVFAGAENPHGFVGHALVALLPGPRGVLARGDVGESARGREDRAALSRQEQGFPTAGREGSQPLLGGQAGGEVGEHPEPVSGEVVSPDSVLGHADTGDDRGPAGARHSRCVVVDVDGREDAGVCEFVQVGRFQHRQQIEADAVDSDDQDAGCGHVLVPSWVGQRRGGGQTVRRSRIKRLA